MNRFLFGLALCVGLAGCEKMRAELSPSANALGGEEVDGTVSAAGGGKRKGIRNFGINSKEEANMPAGAPAPVMRAISAKKPAAEDKKVMQIIRGTKGAVGALSGLGDASDGEKDAFG